MLVTLIITTYNYELYIEKALNSAINQTYKNMEIIIIDDGSTDKTNYIISQYKKIDNRIRFLKQNNKGISYSRNKAVYKSNGDYIIFFDGDDYIKPDYVYNLVNLIEKYDTKIACSAHDRIYRNQTEKTIYPYMTEKISVEEYFERLGNSQLPYRMGIAPWGKIYHKSLFENVFYPNGINFEDSYTTYKLMIKEINVAISSKITYLYYKNNNSITSKKFNLSRLEFIKAESKMKNDLQMKFPRIKNALNRRYDYSKIDTLANIFLSNSFKENKQLSKVLKKEIISGFSNKIFTNEISKRDKVSIITLKLGFPFFNVFIKINENLKSKGEKYQRKN